MSALAWCWRPARRSMRQWRATRYDCFERFLETRVGTHLVLVLVVAAAAAVDRMMNKASGYSGCCFDFQLKTKPGGKLTTRLPRTTTL